MNDRRGLTSRQADGKAQGREEGPEGEVVLQGLGSQALGSVVLVLAAESALHGRGGKAKSAQFHLGFV